MKLYKMHDGRMLTHAEIVEMVHKLELWGDLDQVLPKDFRFALKDLPDYVIEALQERFDKEELREYLGLTDEEPLKPH